MSRESFLHPQAIAAFPDEARRAIYDVISLRRDIRHFEPDREVDADVLQRILSAAHQAPSVGLSQAWGFVVVRERAVRERIRASFLECRSAEAVRFPEARRASYLSHKLEGILEAPINLCVAVDLRDKGEAVLGTTVQPEALRASACCAVENLWLAARAEGIGVGWVSIVEPAVLRRELALPSGVEPVAYLCVGHPIAFRDRPMLEETGWGARRSIAEVVYEAGRWQDRTPPSNSMRSCSNTTGGGPPAAPSNTIEGPIGPLDSEAMRLAREHQAKLTKPNGSLGRLEELAIWYAGVRGRFPPEPVEGTVLVFAADHGVVEEGVSAYGSQITAAMIATVMSGGAAINAIAKSMGLDIVLTDVGVAGDLSAVPTSPLVNLNHAKVRAGTGNIRRCAAMRREEAELAMTIGIETVRAAADRGARAIALGEIGIGNTTAAAALTSALTGEPPARVVGRGTGISDEALLRKVAAVGDALALHRPEAHDPIGVLAALGGFEIAALVGSLLEAARLRLAVVLDGFVTNAAALLAARIDPRVREYMLASHASPEPGASIALAALELRPLLDFAMRLGEGTGGALGVGLLRTAVATQLSMATFATAGIVGRNGIAKETS
jgi:nicotinate-nucleotide--dimethylbenzimidazole phosphoribosyltransferase